MNPPPIIGAHVSTAGGVFHAIENAEKIGARAIQIFGASARQWRGKPPKKEDIEKFLVFKKNSGLKHVFLHAPYLINVASSVPFIQKNSLQCLIAHLKISLDLHADGLIFHPGSAKKPEERSRAIFRVSSSIREALKAVPGETSIIIENTAGGGGKVGASIDDISAILRGGKNPRVKICLDTAHALEAGEIPQYSREGIDAYFHEFERKIGIANLAVIHANDSKSPAHSHFDRHENIGKGYIGMSGFRALAQTPVLQKVPWILEVPGYAGEGPDKKNIDALHSLFL